MRRQSPEYLDLTAVALRLGLKYGTVRQHLWRGRMPDPDILVGRSPAWLPATIDEWDRYRIKQHREGEAICPFCGRFIMRTDEPETWVHAISRELDCPEGIADMLASTPDVTSA